MSELPRQTVLIVDDEADIRVAIEDLLEADYRVIGLGEPAAALDRLKAERDVAVIISDQRMPEMTGSRFLAAARQISDAEAILLTGYADIDAVIAAINEGKVAGYLHKPWTPEALRTMVDLAAQRHRLRRQLELERRLFDGLVQGSGDAIRLLDGAGATLRSNRAPEHGVDDTDRAVLGGGAAEPEEVQDGERWSRIQRIPLQAPNGDRLLLRIESDVTRERAFERRLRQAEKLQALGTLAGGIAHDFNNLLTAVIGNLELAARKPDGPSVPRFVESALEAARRGASLTGRLLSFSRQRAVATEDVDVAALVAGMHDLLARTLGGGVTVQVTDCREDLAVRVDPDQLELAILNLCVNARDALGGAGTITIRCSALDPAEVADLDLLGGSFVSIAVADDGPGMSAATKARVFEPFFTTKPVGQGTGLGLSMVYGFATGLGGTVRIESAEGAGTTVSMILPRATGVPRTSSPATKAAPAMRSLSILLVEDDQAVREVTCRTLEEMGHRVAVCEGPEAARGHLARADPVDLLVTDFAMPGLSGLDLASEARRLRPELPVLLLTGFAEGAAVPPEVERLAKPFSREGLAAAIAAAVGRGH